MAPFTLESLPPLARKLAEEAIAWLDIYGDLDCHLLRYPGTCGHYSSLQVREGEQPHLVRESTFWAVGLLMRNGKEDLAHAHRILEAVLRWQFNAPGTPYHGTFHRAPEEAVPTPERCVMWRDYDPNWRQFIGTTFLIILEKFSERIMPALQARLRDSIQLALEGESPERIEPIYTNIAMMQAILLVRAGDLLQKPDWKEKGLLLARQIYELFAENKTFSEYNSPTYYAVVFHGLRLWRLLSKNPDLEAWGAEMEAALWRQTALYYHPRLRNLCGPFDRAYGMDMTRYVAGIGLWMRLELETAIAPVPLLSEEFDHRHDFVGAPLVALFGTEIPDDVKAELRDFKERALHQLIESKPLPRIATAYLKEDRMWGAESGSTLCWDQFHAVTLHWLHPDGGIAWLRLENKCRVDAVANERGIQVKAFNGPSPASLIWHFSANAVPVLKGDQWELPGMIVRVKTSLPTPILKKENDRPTLTYEIPASKEASLDLEFLPKGKETIAFSQKKS